MAIDWKFRIKRDAPNIVVTKLKDGDYWVHRRKDRKPYGSILHSIDDAYWKAVEMEASSRGPY
jgi:hypothetical protein